MKVAIAGAGGRMGRTLIDGVLADRELELSAALDVPGSDALGQPAGPVRITMPVNELCYSCHEEFQSFMKDRSHKHPPAKESCTNCQKLKTRLIDHAGISHFHFRTDRCR